MSKSSESIRMVKYDSSINQIRFYGFEKVHMDIFMALCSYAYGCGSGRISIKLSELSKDISFTRGSSTKIVDGVKTKFRRELNSEVERTKELIDGISDQLTNMFLANRNVSGEAVTFFSEFVIIKKQLEYKISLEYVKVLNDVKLYTRFPLKEFVQIKSIYGKHLYRILKQYRENWYKRNVEEFWHVMNISIDGKKYSELKRDCIMIAVKNLKALGNDYVNLIYIDENIRKKTDGVVEFRWGKGAEKYINDEIAKQDKLEQDGLRDDVKDNTTVDSEMPVKVLEKEDDLQNNCDLQKAHYYTPGIGNVELAVTYQEGSESKEADKVMRLIQVRQWKQELLNLADISRDKCTPRFDDHQYKERVRQENDSFVFKLQIESDEIHIGEGFKMPDWYKKIADYSEMEYEKYYRDIERDNKWINR